LRPAHPHVVTPIFIALIVIVLIIFNIIVTITRLFSRFLFSSRLTNPLTNSPPTH